MKIPKGLTDHPAVKMVETKDTNGSDSRYIVHVHAGYYFTSGHAAGCSGSIGVDTVAEFKASKPELRDVPACPPGEPLAVMTLAARINNECLDWLEIPGTEGELMLVAMPHGVVTMFADMNGYATPEECYSAAPHLHRIVAPSWNAYVVDLTKRAAPECVAVLHAVMYEPNAEVMARAVEVVRDRRLTAEYLAAHDDEPATLDDGTSCNEQVRALAAEQARADAARKLSGVPSLYVHACRPPVSPLTLSAGPFSALTLAAHDDGDDDNPCGYINHYKCYTCGAEWIDEWDCGVDDECGECGARDVSPYLSEQVQA